MVAWTSALPTSPENLPADVVVSFDLFQRKVAAASHNTTLQTTLANAHAEIGQGGYYFITVEIGTPPQALQLVLDTGSSDFWVYGSKMCAPPQDIPSVFPRCFNESLSSSVKPTKNLPKFVGAYGGGGTSTSTNGTYITDTVTIGGETLKDITLAVVETGTKIESAGILGMSYDFDEDNQVGTGVKYPSVLDVFFNRGHIKSHTFSLYLNDINAPSGSLLFGGYDTAKYTGPLVPLPIFSPTGISQLAVPLGAVSITNASGSTGEPIGLYPSGFPVILDSGTPETASLPNKTYQSIVKYIRSLGYNVTDIASSQPIVDCALSQAQGSIDLTFLDATTSLISYNVTISVPLSELAVSVKVNGTVEGCYLGVNNYTAGGALFGDTFMRSMYIVYDFDNNVIALAQSRFNAQAESSVVPIGRQPRYGGKVWFEQPVSV